MSDRQPTTERGRVRVVGFEEAVADRFDESGTGSTTPATASDRATGSQRDRPRRRRFRSTWRRFRRNRAAVAGLSVIAAMAVLALFARPIEVSTAQVTITLQPFSLAPYGPGETFVGPANAPPSAAHPFGTDWAGRDIFSRLLVGGRYTLGIGLVAVVLALGVGIPLGATAGYFGGWADEILMRIVDVLYAFPFLVLAIALVPILEPVPVLGSGFWTVVVALVLTGWVGYARLLRGEVLSIREREYVTAARALGVPDRTILRRHVVPNAVAPVVVQATLNVGTVVLTAAALGFLGLGLEPGSAEWGAMLSQGRDSLIRGDWHVTVFPGLAIFLFVLSINLVGDGLNDALDPSRDVADERGRLR
ncbi:ABC transporter permease [Natrinema marinum]|uniref:ABC transporter permease n=1 Tax=Natrinema marinum TaxID=2961598 RepID=UPI0020C871A1|nr:ABC transporter permease [Natrinema marinum]